MAGFVCVYYGNTGSSWLMAVLAGSPQVLVPGFEPIESWVWDAPRGERVEWLRTALSPPAERVGPAYDGWVKHLQTSPQVDEMPNKPGFRYVGLKMNDLAVVETEAVAGVLEETKTKAIVLIRDNRIKHALSLYRYHEEGKSQFGGKGIKPPTKVRLRRFDDWVKESGRLHGESLRVRETLLHRMGPGQVISLSYEEFTTENGKRDTIDRLTDFLGIEPIELSEGRFVKATPDDLSSAVVNFKTLRLRYALTPMRHFFEE